MTFWEQAAWIDRLPRPDRSGAIGAVMMVSMWLAVITPYGGNSDLVCSVFPWKCHHEQIEAQEERSRKVKYVSLAFYGSPAKSKPLCACHYDFRLKNEGDKIHHVCSGDHPFACDSEFYWPNTSNEWADVASVTWRSDSELDHGNIWFQIQTAPAALPQNAIWTMGPSIRYELHAGDLVRNHCTDDPQYLTQYGEQIQ